MILKQEAQSLEQRCIELHQKAKSSFAGFEEVVYFLSGIDIEEIHSNYNGLYETESAALLHAIADKVIPDEWTWTIRESMDGRVMLQLTEKRF